MEFEQLRQFVEVARSGSFSRAAVKLSVSQPYLSQRIGALEAELRRHLFLRHGRGIALTDAGQRFFETAVSVISQLEVATEAITEEDAELRGKITIGVPPSVVYSVSVALFRRFIERFPNARLAIVEQLSSVLQESVLAHRVDIAFMSNAPLTGGFETTVLVRQPVCLISKNGIGSEGSIRLSALSDIPLIMPGEPHPLRAMLEMAASSKGIELNIPYEVDGVDTILHLVEEGIASTVSTAGIMQRGRYAATLHAQPLTDPDIASVLYLATAARRPRTILLQRTLELAREVAASELGVPLETVTA